MPTPAGKIQRNATGKINRNASGKVLLGTGTDTCCCAGLTYRVRKCCGNAYVNYEITPPTVPFYFKYNVGAGLECLYITATSTSVTPGTYTNIPTAGLATYVSCNDCIGVDDCIPCASATACASCIDVCNTATNTPTQFTITLAGISLISGCIVSGAGCDWAPIGGPYSMMIDDSWTGGTYTISQTASCTWQADVTGPSLTLYTVNADCTGATTVSSIMRIVLKKESSPVNWSLQVKHLGFEVTFFYVDGQTGVNTSAFKCCTPTTVSNRIVLATRDLCGDSGLSCCYIGDSGTATITPC